MKSHQLGREGLGIQLESLILLMLLPLKEKHDLLRLGCENENENAVAHRAVVIN